MSRTSSIVGFAILLAGVAGACTGGRRGGFRRPAVDSGPPPGTDGGPGGGRDSGFVAPDGGPPPECVFPTDCPSSFTCTGGRCVPGSPTSETDCANFIDDDMDGATDCVDSDCATDPACTATTCGVDTVSPVTGAYCSSATQTCISGGGDPNMCLSSDPNPDCATCVNQNLIACGNSQGCQRMWDLYSCCVSDRCGMMPTTTCIDANCMAQSTAYTDCLMPLDLATLCPTVLSDCF